MQHLKEKATYFFRPRFDYRAQSRLGIFSFLTALLVAFILIGEVELVIRFQNDPETIRMLTSLDPVLTWVMAFLAFTGLILGLTSVAQKKKRRLLGLAGMITNGFFLIAIFSLYLVNIVAFWRLATVG